MNSGDAPLQLTPDVFDTGREKLMQVQGLAGIELSNAEPSQRTAPAAGAAIEVPHIAYRADIDGLRALAVLPVVFYHAGVRGFSGGFVGVDIFFVISGYLITGILAQDAFAGRLLISEFYRRRILRIFPALFVMFASVTLAAWMTMLPSEISRFAKSLASAALFSSNVQSFLDVDYFGPSSAVRPLLHTWSLAVEEQWYILWPLLIAGMGRKRSDWLLPVACFITLASLVFGIWQTASTPSAAFYLLPARAWELGLGACVALMGQRKFARWQLEMAGVLGLVLILASVKLYTHETRFPGVAAIAPCLGAALLILSGGQVTWAARMLSIGPARFIGKISYSLYLWHWPVMVFAQIGLFLPKTPWVMAGEISISLLLALLSWRFVERPFRANGKWPARQTLSAGALAIGVALAFAWASPSISGGFMQFTDAQARIARYVDLDGDALYRRDVCFAVGAHSTFDAARCLGEGSGKPSILLIGDSHAAALWPGLSRHTDRFDIHQATATSCVAKLYDRPERTRCAEVLNQALRDWLPGQPPSATLFASRWKSGNLHGLESTLNDARIKAGHPVLIGPVPEYSAAVPRLLVFADRRSDPGLVRRSLDPEIRAIDKQLKEIASRTSTPYISMIDLLCTTEGCTTATASGAPLQFDQGHLSAEGSTFIVDAILPRIQEIAVR